MNIVLLFSPKGSTTIPLEGSTPKLVEVGRPKQIKLWDKI